MKNKCPYYIDRWKKKIMKGSDKKYNTLIVNENRLKWDNFYKQKIIDRFQTIYNNRSEVIKIKTHGIGKQKKISVREKITTRPKREYVSRALIGIQNRNEQLRNTIETFNKIIKGE